MSAGLSVSGRYLTRQVISSRLHPVPPALPHIMIVSDRKNGRGVPLVIHNIGRGTREEDRLLEFPITGHFRLPADAQRPRPD